MPDGVAKIRRKVSRSKKSVSFRWLFIRIRGKAMKRDAKVGTMHGGGEVRESRRPGENETVTWTDERT
jgi:hypothetical protein